MVSSSNIECRTRKTLAELIGNNGLNAGIVLPAIEPDALAERLTPGHVLRVKINGRTIDSGDLWPLPGGAKASLDWLRSHLGQCGLSLSPGQLVLAGTPLGLHPVSAGDHVLVTVDHAVCVECRVT